MCIQGNRDTSFYYNQLSAQLVGNYESWAFAQHVKDWGLATYMTVLGAREYLAQQSLAAKVWADHPGGRGAVHPRHPHQTQAVRKAILGPILCFRMNPMRLLATNGVGFIA